MKKIIIGLLLAAFTYMPLSLINVQASTNGVAQISTENVTRTTYQLKYTKNVPFMGANVPFNFTFYASYDPNTGYLNSIDLSNVTHGGLGALTTAYSSLIKTARVDSYTIKATIEITFASGSNILGKNTVTINVGGPR